MSRPENVSKIFLCSVAWMAIVPIVFLVFSGAVKNEFVAWDDPNFVQTNLMIRSLSADNLWKMLTSFQTANWHPLTWISHAIDYHVFQLNPAGHHLTNIVLHCLNAVWVFWLFVRLAVKNAPEFRIGPSLFAGGAIAAILFGVHPLRVESVAWISERKDLLCAFFVLATYWAYLSYASAIDSQLRRRWYFAALLLMILALMSKPMAVTIPLVFLLFDFYPLRRWRNSRARLIIEKLPFLALSLLDGVITLIAQRQENAMVPLNYFGLTERTLNAAGSILFYIGKTVWPFHLVPRYALSQNISLSNVPLVLAVVAVLAISLFCIWMVWIKKPLPLAVWLYYLITAAPVIGIIQVGGQSAADHYTYLPTLSFYFLAGIGITRLLTLQGGGGTAPSLAGIRGAGPRNLLVLSCSMIVIAGLGYLTAQQTKVWKNSETLWQYTAKEFPGQSALVEYNLAKIDYGKGLLKEAEEKYKTVLKIMPDYIGALNGLGLIYHTRGLHGKAEELYKRALKIRVDPIIANNLGVLYFDTGRLDEARDVYLAVIDAKPDSLEAYNNLGLVYDRLGLSKEAEAAYKAAITIDFDYVLAHINLGILYKNKGLPNQAIIEFQLVLYHEPNRAEIHRLLGEVYSGIGLTAEAEAEFKEVRRLCPDSNCVHP